MKTFFVVLASALLALVGWAAYKDTQARGYLDIQDRYKHQYGGNFDTKVQQAFPAFAAAQRGDTLRPERCISCHVPDIASLGPQNAAQRLVDEFKRWEPDWQRIVKANGLTLTHPALVDQALYAKFGASATATSDGFRPYQVIDPATGQKVDAALPGPIPAFLDPAQNSGKPWALDAIGCIVCHNGGRLALDQQHAHQNLIVNPNYAWSAGADLYYKNCVSCHGVLGEGAKGPPLNNQDRLGFFNEDYYYRCIEYGMTDFEHVGSAMPNWGSIASDYSPDPANSRPLPISAKRQLSEDQINLLVQFIRHWENYNTLP